MPNSFKNYFDVLSEFKTLPKYSPEKIKNKNPQSLLKKQSEDPHYKITYLYVSKVNNFVHIRMEIVKIRLFVKSNCI